MKDNQYDIVNRVEIVDRGNKKEKEILEKKGKREVEKEQEGESI